MTAFLIALLEGAACLGLGVMLVRMLRLDGGQIKDVELPLAFALGFGVLGWIVFPLAVAGLIAAPVMATLLVVSSMGLIFVRRAWLPNCAFHPTASEYLMLAILAAILLLGLAQAIPPPVDGDSMAYHFARIKQTAQDGRFIFLPQAIEGTAPMLAQMTYLPAFVLGGEQAMTIWTLLSGLAPGWLFFILARRWLCRKMALFLTLLLLTTPAIVYGTVSGQVEVRNTLFVLAAIAALLSLYARRSPGFAVAAGMAAGFFAGAKSFGLLFLPAAGLAVLLRRDWFKSGLLFGLTALFCGCQIYLFNFLQSGDPIFPMLHNLLGRPDGPWWDAAHALDLKAYLKDIEAPVPTTLGWLLAYPIKATLNGLPVWESGRTGLGPVGLMLLPLAILGLVQRAVMPGRSPLWNVALIVFLFYVLWFFFGGAQKVRHLLPLYPPLLLLLGIAAFKPGISRAYVKPAIAALGIVLFVQLAGLGLFSLNPLRQVIAPQSREDYLRASIPLFDAVPWVNDRLGASDRLLVTERQLLYHLDVPYFFAHPLHQARIDLRPDSKADVETRWQSMRDLGVTHIMLTPELGGHANDTALHRTVADLLSDNCLRRLQVLEGRVFVSRTLAGHSPGRQLIEIYELTRASCRLEQSLPKLPDLATNTLISHKERPR